MSPIDPLILHLGHTSGSLPGWLLLVPLLPVAVLGAARLGLRLWPSVRRWFGSGAEPI